MTTPPSPHPLDFDWRYDDATARQLADMLIGKGHVLALGAPSVARLLDGAGADVTLVDRQPLQGVRRHEVCEVADFATTTTFAKAIVDPPWYPSQLLEWSKVAARAVEREGAVLMSIWPARTRPGAVSELDTVLDEIARWAKIQRGVARLGYTEPGFERAARACGDTGPLSTSPLEGELIELTIERVPDRDPGDRPAIVWQRFTVDDYQIAVRAGGTSRSPSIRAVPGAHGWVWPHVSARAPSIGEISIWSSEGEVGMDGDAPLIVDALRRALATTDDFSFEHALTDVPELLAWRIPRPPYRRSIEWRHRQ